jgi:NADH-quinone oxidoreductase subunit K
LDHYLMLSFLLFSIGVPGVVFRRNTIIILMCLELMLNSVNLLLTAFSAYHSDPARRCSCSSSCSWRLRRSPWAWPSW